MASACVSPCSSQAAPTTAKAASIEEAQDFAYGAPFTPAVEDAILEDLSPAYVNGLTLLGGEPFEPGNQRALLPFLRRVKARFPEQDSGPSPAMC